MIYIQPDTIIDDINRQVIDLWKSKYQSTKIKMVDIQNILSLHHPVPLNLVHIPTDAVL